MSGLWRYGPWPGDEKYVVQRRDGTVPPWPWFVLGGRDPLVPWTLRVYAVLALAALWDWSYSRDVWRLAGDMVRYRRTCGTGDPNAPKHRTDDPATVEKLRTRT